MSEVPQPLVMVDPDSCAVLTAAPHNAMLVIAQAPSPTPLLGSAGRLRHHLKKAVLTEDVEAVMTVRNV